MACIYTSKSKFGSDPAATCDCMSVIHFLKLYPKSSFLGSGMAKFAKGNTLTKPSDFGGGNYHPEVAEIGDCSRM